jgi:glutathione S-transferase
VKLYDYGPSANCLKARILLGLLGTAYERVPVDIFAGESQTPEHLARNPAGRTPVLELESGETIPESNAILVHLARGTRFLPDEPVAQSRVLGWLFFEQNLVEPNVGTARIWRLTGRDDGREQVVARFVEAGSAALDILERHLQGREWLVGDAQRSPISRSTPTYTWLRMEVSTSNPARLFMTGWSASKPCRDSSTTFSRTRPALRPERAARLCTDARPGRSARVRARAARRPRGRRAARR